MDGVVVSSLTPVLGEWIIMAHSAEVAELVDAPGSGSGGRKPVGVRVSSSAPTTMMTRQFGPGFLFMRRSLSEETQLGHYNCKSAEISAARRNFLTDSTTAGWAMYQFTNCSSPSAMPIFGSNPSKSLALLMSA